MIFDVDDTDYGYALDVQKGVWTGRELLTSGWRGLNAVHPYVMYFPVTLDMYM
jgi:hypothetical protein